MNSASLFRKYASAIALAAVAAVTSSASTPVAVWNGDFAKLTRINGNVAYTMNVNKDNATISADGSDITIGTLNAEPTVTITANVAGAFGSTAWQGFTVIARVANAGSNAAGGNKAVLNYYSETTEAGIALAQYGNMDGQNGRTFPMLNNGAYHDTEARLTPAGTLSSDGSVQTIALSYGTNPQGGTAFYVNGREVYAEAAMTSQYFSTPDGISIGGLAIYGSNKLYASSGMKIYAVAVFTNRLTTAEVEAYTSEGGFPTGDGQSAISVSTINGQSGFDGEVYLDDGDIVYGDTAFDASAVNFHCNGSFTLWAPAGNTATFDFSGVTGRPILAYGAIPTVSGDVFTATTVPTWITDSAKWTGTVGLNGVAIAGPDFNLYGNASSAIMLSGVSGWVNTGTEYSVPFILENGMYDFALKLNNGNSPQNNNVNSNRCSMLCKVCGTGDLVDGIDEVGGTAWPVIKIYDASDFSGSITLSRANAIVCNSDTTFENSLFELFYYEYGKCGTLRVESGESIGIAAGKVWSVAHVLNNGTLTGAGRISTTTAEVPGGAYTSAGWTGTVVISNVASATPLNLQNHGTADSTVLLTAIGGTSAYLPSGDATVGRVILEDAGDAPALKLSDGYSNGNTEFAELAGSGTLTQGKAAILQGVTINVMTNFTGTLAFNKMTVTFGATRRRGQKQDGDGNWIKDEDTASRLFIDPDAVLSVPAGFALWSPDGVVLNGPVNFTTVGASLSRQIVLFSDIGPDFTFGEKARILLNGTEVDALNYRVKVVGTDLVLKRKSMAISYR